jgi:hypothetical protein
MVEYTFEYFMIRKKDATLQFTRLIVLCYALYRSENQGVHR